jgi:hypothetical protein
MLSRALFTICHSSLQTELQNQTGWKKQTHSFEVESLKEAQNEPHLRKEEKCSGPDLNRRTPTGKDGS